MLSVVTSYAVGRSLVHAATSYPTDGDGFPAPAWLSSSDYFPVEDVAPHASLAVLGEPGVGKSTAIAQICAARSDVSTVHLDEVTSGEQFESALASAVANARAAETPTVVLDGLDESALAVKAFVRRLKVFLESHGQFEVVIGCRAANWPDPLGSLLEELRPGFVAYELLPLGAADVQDAAAANGLDGQEFLAEVRRTGVAGLASRPLTLNLLLELYKDGGRLPGTPSDLFAKGVRVLATEHDEIRANPRSSVGTSEQRVFVASRLAASLAVSGKAALTTASPAAASDIYLDEVAGGLEGATGRAFDVTPALVADTVETALFSRRGTARFAPTHASLSAYLAARYLVERQFPEHQLRALLTRNTASNLSGIPTQLHETAAWLLALAPDTNYWVVDLAPDAMLTHAAYIRDDAVRSKLVEALLNDQGFAFQMRSRRWRLRHEGLLEQLKPHLQGPLQQDAGPDFGHPVSARAGVAIDIATQSGEVDATTLLVELAMTSTLNPYLRARAGRGVARLDPATAQERFLPLLDEVIDHPERDPDDELRGLALRSCHLVLSAEQLIEGMRPSPHNTTLIGSYEIFLRDAMRESSSDQIRALTRLARTDSAARDVLLSTKGFGGPSQLSSLVHRALHDPQLRAELWDDAVWLLTFCVRSRKVVRLPRALLDDQGGHGDAGARRELAVAASAQLEAGEIVLLTRPVLFADSTRNSEMRSAALIGSADFEWLCRTGDGLSAEGRTSLIKFLYDLNDAGHVDALTQLASSGTQFDWVLPWMAQVEQSREDERIEVESAPQWPGLAEHLRTLEAAAETVVSGKTDACGELVALLAIGPESGYPLSIVETTIAFWPGWTLVELGDSGLTLPDLANACAHFLRRADIPTGPWLTDARQYSQTVRQLAAMAELAVSEGTTDLTPDEWSRLVPVMVRSPYNLENSRGREKAISKIADVAPNELRHETLRYLNDQLAADWSSSTTLWMLNPVFDADTASALVSFAGQLSPRLANAEEKLAELEPDPSSGTAEAIALADVRQKVFGLRQWIGGVLDALLSRHGQHLAEVREQFGDESSTPLSIQAQTALLMTRNQHQTWADAWARASADDDFATELVNALARYLDNDQPFLAFLTPQDLGGLWRWLATRWPPASDNWKSGFTTVEQSRRNLRDGVARHLAQRTNAESLEVLRALASDHKDTYLLRDLVDGAAARLLDELWEGTTPQELFTLVEDSSRVVVHDTDSLARLVVRVLNGLAQRLGDVGELLWNEVPAAHGAGSGASSGTASKASSRSSSQAVSTFRPKHEAQISLLIHDHLRAELSRGIVSNREVLVRQTTARGAGLAADVLVTAVDPAVGGRELVCPIEVKGNWNRNLLTDLREQLVDDYMTNLSAPFGVYAYAWFDPKFWTDEADHRLTQVRKFDRAKVAADLQLAASEALKVGARVHVQELDVPRAVRSARVQK